MGERINFVFDDGTDSLVNLYSHWGESDWENDLIGALVHAQKRKGDYSYFTRMVISHLIKDYVLDETGFGIYAINRSEIVNNFEKEFGIKCGTFKSSPISLREVSVVDYKGRLKIFDIEYAKAKYDV